EMESAATVRRHPKVIARAARDEGYWPSRSITFRRLYWLSLIEERAFFGASFRADPEPPTRICLERVDKIAARLALNLFRFAVVDADESATLRAGIKSIVKKSQTRDFQKSGMIFVGTLERLIGNCVNCESDRRITLGIGYGKTRRSFLFGLTIKDYTAFT